MKKIEFWTAWLKIVSIMIIAVGLFLALLKETPLMIVFDAPLNPYFWKSSIPDGGTILFKNLMYSLMGAAMTVWGIQLYFVVKFAFGKCEKWAWYSILISTLVWFVIDEGFSIYYGIIFNAVFNIPFLLLLIIPIIMTRKYFIIQKPQL